MLVINPPAASRVTSNTSGATWGGQKLALAVTSAEARGVPGSRVSLTSAPALLLFLHSLGNNGRHAPSAHPLCLPLTPTRGSRVGARPHYTAVRRKKQSNSITQSQPTSAPRPSLQLQSCGLYPRLTPLLCNCPWSFVVFLLCSASHTNMSLFIPPLCYSQAKSELLLSHCPLWRDAVLRPRVQTLTSICVIFAHRWWFGEKRSKEKFTFRN